MMLWNDLCHALDVDDTAAVNAHELLRIEASLDGVKRRSERITIWARVHADVVAV